MYELPAKTEGENVRRNRKAGAYFIGVILPGVAILLWLRRACQQWSTRIDAACSTHVNAYLFW